MKLEEIVNENVENDIMSLIKLKKILGILKDRQTAGDNNATSVKKKILSRWKNGEKAVSNYKQELDSLDINLHDIIKN